jgi:hypothetical protein
MREIVILTQHGTEPNRTSFMGRWLAQCLDPATGGRYSVAQRADGAFVTIAKYDSGEFVEMRVFADVAAIRDAELPVSLKSAAEKAPNARRAPQLQPVQRIPKDQTARSGSLKVPCCATHGALRHLRLPGFLAGSLQGIRLLPMHTAIEAGPRPRRAVVVAPEIGKDW